MSCPQMDKQEHSPSKPTMTTDSICNRKVSATSELTQQLQAQTISTGDSQTSQQQIKCFDPKICDSCDTVITDYHVMRVVTKSVGGNIKSDKCWHERCLICCMCGKNMQDKCFENEGRLYCFQDYYRLFSERCFTCKKEILPSDMIMRPMPGRYCHTTCFRCVTCNYLLETGDLYSANFEYGWLYCRNHTMERSNPYNQPQHNHMLMHSNADWSDDCMDDMSSKNDKRPRTVLSTSQRRVLKLAFDMDPKPSKKARYTMSEETGLTSRVVQVWFQNQRAKMKKRVKCSGADDSSDSDPAVKKEEIFQRAGSSSTDDNFGPTDADETEIDQRITFDAMNDEDTDATYTQLEVPPTTESALYSKSTDNESQFSTTLTSFY